MKSFCAFNSAYGDNNDDANAEGYTLDDYYRVSFFDFVIYIVSLVFVSVLWGKIIRDNNRLWQVRGSEERSDERRLKRSSSKPFTPPSYITNNLPLVASLLVSPFILSLIVIRFTHRRNSGGKTEVALLAVFPTPEAMNTDGPNSLRMGSASPWGKFQRSTEVTRFPP